MKTANDDLKVSVVIPAFNEAYKIKDCLESLSKQDYKNIEIILVNDCSTDKTAIIARKTGDALKLTLKIIQLNKHQERGIARNLGAKQAKGEHLLFIDADMTLTKKVVEECTIKILGKSDIVGIIIPEESFGVGFWANVRALEKKCYLGDDSIEAARFFEREAFWNVGGWDEKMISGEDWDLTRRIRERYKVIRINAKIFHNEGRLTLWKVFKKKFYYASKAGVYFRKYPLKFTDLVFFIFRPAYIRNWKLLSLDPLHAIGMFFLKAIEMFAGGLGYLFSKLPNRP